MAMSTVLLAVAAGGSLIQGIGAYQQGRFQSAIAKRNAEVARRAAVRERERGHEQAEAVGQRYRRLRGAQLTAFAANGISLASGGVYDVMDQTADAAARAQLDARTQAEWTAYDFMTQAAGQEARARQARRAGTMGLLGGIVGAASTGLRGAADAGWDPFGPAANSDISGDPAFEARRVF